MHQQFNVSNEERKRAKWPHEIFLINLIFNHIFVFCATASVFGTFPLFTALVPAISFAIIAYILIKGRLVAASDEPWFVKAHWQIGAWRNTLFMMLLSVACIVSGGGYWLSGMFGWAKIPTLALIGGMGLLPFMVVLLVLIVLSNESLYMAGDGKLPKNFAVTNHETQVQQTSFPQK